MKLSGCFLFLFFFSCTDPVIPEFEYKEGLIFIEGFAATEPGASFVSINESAIEFGVYKVNFVQGATVNFENINTGNIVSLTEVEGVYQPPLDFKTSEGDKWILNITLSNGKRYASAIETVLQSVPIKNLEVEYNPQLVYREVFGGKFLPGHDILVSFDDPVDQENNYYWTYRVYENLDICEHCDHGVFRDGACQGIPPGPGRPPYYDYACDVDCWRIRFPESIAIFEDSFSNGKEISRLSIGNALLYTKENIVIEVQQLSLSPVAYNYYKVLKDIVDNSSGLNAPPPAALVGNLFNPDDSEDFVFGRFTAAASSSSSIFVDRFQIRENPIERKDEVNFEDFGDPVPPPETITAPCLESKFRTTIVPRGWIEN